MGKNDIEDALKRLDRLTQEEARMAAAQLLKVTNTIDNRVGGIADNVLVVDNRVAGTDDRVAGVDERVAGVDDRVKDVDGKVKAVDDKLVAVIDGAHYLQSIIENRPTHNASRWKRGQGFYPTSSFRRRSGGTFVVPEPHSCRAYRLNHPHRESITTGSP
jgi:hypothetical protein